MHGGIEKEEEGMNKGARTATELVIQKHEWISVL